MKYLQLLRVRNMVIGEVIADEDKVLIETAIGGIRILETPIADPVPRVC